MIITLVLCVLWMRLINFITKKGILTSAISRKIIHIGTGPLFILCWLLFPDVKISRYLAAIVPLLIVFQVLLVGLGKMKDISSVQSMARTGAKAELLKGPLFYGIVFVFLTLFFWKSHLAVIPLMILCGGDGAADLIGSRVSSRKLPWTKNKTVIGSISMLIGGVIFSLILLYVLKDELGNIPSIRAMVLPVFIITAMATVVESFTPSDYDNFTVPATALLMSLILI